MRASDRLLQSLRDELGLDISDTATIRRTRAGRHQAAAGAWSWYLTDDEMSSPLIDRLGSQ